MQQSYSIKVYHHFMCDTLSCLIFKINLYLYLMTKINYKFYKALLVRELDRYQAEYDKYSSVLSLNILTEIQNELFKVNLILDKARKKTA